MKNNFSIEQIITGCKKGQPVHQRALVDGYSELLYSVALRYMGEKMLAQDVLQEAFIRIFRFINDFDSDKGSLTAWMRKITVNVALKKLSKKKHKVTELSYEVSQKLSTEADILDKLNCDEILDVVRSLPDGYRQIFNLSVIEGYSHREIGEMIGIQEVSSRSKLSRAKQLLRNKLLNSYKSESWTKRV